MRKLPLYAWGCLLAGVLNFVFYWCGIHANPTAAIPLGVLCIFRFILCVLDD